MDDYNDLKEKLAELQQVEKKLEELEEERTQIRDEIFTIMQAHKLNTVDMSVNDISYAISANIRKKFTYDEGLLKQRLGDKFKLILEPEYHRFKKAIPEITPFLEPVIEKVGVVSRRLVEEQINNNVIGIEKFQGAFTVEEKPFLVVRKRKK